jgi:hypothetical protein
MKGCLRALGIFAGVAVALIVLVRLNFYNIHVRYRLTVEVQDGDQLKTGSSVIDLSYNIEPSWSPSHFNSFPVPVGYAPTVDLGEKGLLFVTFSNATRTPEQQSERQKPGFCLFDDIGCLPFAAYGKSGGGADFRQKKIALDALLRESGPRDVPFVALPKLARFRDGDDQRLLVHVSPYDLAATFGPSVELKRVALQLTNDPITPPPKIWPQWLTIKHHNTVLRGYEDD